MVLRQTKFLVPPSPADQVSRAGLVAELSASLERQIAVLVAPAGYGKTTVMTELVEAAAIPTLWYQLDHGDNDPAAFVAHLAQGLASTLPAVGERVGQILHDAGPQPADRSMSILGHELLEHSGEPWLLALDDYHVIGNPDVHGFTAGLLEERPPGMRVVLASRSTPPLPLARLRARGRLTQLGATQLRLDDAGARAWLERAAPHLPPDAVQRVVDRCEGWGAGLQLARSLFTAGSSTADVETWIPRLTGDHPYVADFLVSEVFARQRPEIRRFLLETAVLPQMTDELCAALLDDPAARGMLAELDRAQLFVVPLDGERRWYRYHQLFREFLLARVEAEGVGPLDELRTRACRILEAAGEPEAALREYLATGRSGDAQRVLLDIGDELLQAGRLEQLDGYLAQLATRVSAHADLSLLAGRASRRLGRPAEALDHLVRAAEQGPDLGVACAATVELVELAHARGEYGGALAHARRAVELAASANLTQWRAVALMELAKNEGLLHGMDRGRARAEEAVQAGTSPDSGLTPFRQAQLLRSLGEICWWHGDLGAAVDACQRALRRLPAEQSPLGAEIRLTLAAAILYRHEYDRALAYAEEALALCQRFALQERLPKAYAVLGNTLTRLGRFEEAEQRLRRAIDLADDSRAASYDGVMAAGYLAYNLQARQRHGEATQIARSALWHHRNREPVYEVYVCRSVLADCHLSEGRIDEAKAIFQELIPVGEARRYRIPLAMAYFGLAYIHLREGSSERAIPAALRSLELIEPSGAWELYADQGHRADTVCAALADVVPDHPFLAVVQNARRAAGGHLRAAPRVDTVRIDTFGGLTVSRDGEVVPAKAWVSSKARELLALFVTFRTDEISLERAMEALWPDEPERDRSAFHTALYRLREALRREGEKTKFVVVENKLYHLDTARFTIDVDAFDLALQSARAGTDEASERALRSAVDLARGEYLSDFDHPWLEPERARLRRALLDALRGLAARSERRGETREALRLVHRALEIDPLLESVHCDAMRLHHALGDRHGVLRQFRDLTQVLATELDVEPMQASRELYHRLTQGT